MNCLFACTFDFLFVFAYTGWEGSSTDAHVLESTLDNGFDIPDGYYYLADTGYAVLDKLLTLYCGVQYHLAKWHHADQQEVTYFSYLIEFKLTCMIEAKDERGTLQSMPRLCLQCN